MLFNVKWMYSFYQDDVLFEEVVSEECDQERIAVLFTDHHVAFIYVNEILYGRNFGGSWNNNYLSKIEDYMMGAPNPYESEDINRFNDWEDSLLYY